MATAKISNVGQRCDLEIVQGATLYPVKHELHNPDGSPLDLTDCTVRGQIRKTAKSTGAPVAMFTVVYPANRTEGWYTFGLSDETTGGIACGASLAAPESQYVYDIELEDASGNVMQMLYGIVGVQPGATRA